MTAPLESSPELIRELEFMLSHWDRLTEAERQFVVDCSRFLTRGYRVNKYMMAVRPNLYPKQQTFLSMNDLEVYTGGSGGGGKSDSLLLAALQYADCQTYSAVIFRSTFKNLNRSGSIMDRCRDWLRDSDAHWDGNDFRFTFPSGAKIGFGYMESLKHADQHRSAEYSFEAYDEVTEIPEECYRFLFSRLRRNKNGPNIPLRVRCASNPGGEHAVWVKSRFIPDEYLACKDNDYRFSRPWEKSDPCEDCDATGFVKGEQCIYCDGVGRQVRLFLPSRVQDNPALDANEYRKSLSRMTWVERMQVEHGDWDITAEGGVFRMAWLRYYSVQGDYLKLTRFDEHNRPLPPVIVSLRDMTVFVTADTATKEKTTADYSVIATWTFDRKTGSLCLLDVIRKKLDTPELLPLLSGACLQSHAKFVLIEEASSGVELLQILRKNNACVGGIPVKSYLTGSKDKVTRSTPAQLRMESGMIYFPQHETTWKTECVAELLSFPKSANDDFVDNVSMAAWYAENHRTIHISGGGGGDMPVEVVAGPSIGYNRLALDQY
jgi:predicted phage terminase large subunit-like protein